MISMLTEARYCRAGAQWDDVWLNASNVPRRVKTPTAGDVIAADINGDGTKDCAMVEKIK
jgi:hypothetical protein